jgi:DNA-binding HxlR family transcriptional regulator
MSTATHAPQPSHCHAGAPGSPTVPQMEAMVRDLIAKVADKWTMLVLEALEERGCMRFSKLGEVIGGVSQKMLTKTLRQMECDGLVKRTVHPVIPPHVEYELTDLGLSLGEAFCPLWTWVQAHYQQVEAARATFRAAQNR